MRDVLSPDRLLGQPAGEGGSQRVLAIGGEQFVQTIDIADPDARPSMCELRQVLECRPPELEQVLAQQIAPGALPFPETAATCCARCSGSVDFAPGSKSR